MLKFAAFSIYTSLIILNSIVSFPKRCPICNSKIVPDILQGVNQRNTDCSKYGLYRVIRMFGSELFFDAVAALLFCFEE